MTARVSKRIFAFAIVLIMTFAMLPITPKAANPTSGHCGEAAYWEVVSNGEGTYKLMITGTGDLYDYSSYPNYVGYYYNDVTEVEIEEGITGIGDYSLSYFYYLTSCSIPSTVTRIGDYAFYYSFS